MPSSDRLDESRPTAGITVHLGGSRERKGQQEAAGAGRRFSCEAWGTGLATLNYSLVLGTRAAGIVQPLDGRLQGQSLFFWSIFIALMQVVACRGKRPSFGCQAGGCRAGPCLL